MQPTLTDTNQLVSVQSSFCEIQKDANQLQSQLEPLEGK